MLRCLIFITLAVLLCSCAKPPHQELEAAEYMIGKAYSMQADEFAPSEYQAARTALDDGREAIQQSDYNDARDSLKFAVQHAERAVVVTEEVKARREAEAKERAAAEEAARQAAQLANLAEKEKVTKPEVPKPTQPKKKPKPKITPANNYNVGNGETLWTISAQPEVYNEGLLWPLLYQANRDQIKDPRQIFPGQTLSIRRDMNQAELDDARQRARESDIFPVSAETAPKQ